MLRMITHKLIKNKLFYYILLNSVLMSKLANFIAVVDGAASAAGEVQMT